MPIDYASRFAIDELAFLDLKGAPIQPEVQVEVRQHPGFDGTTIFLGGTQGQPFALLSIASCADIDAAKELEAEYRAKKGQVVELTWQGLTYDCQFCVLEVRLLEMRAAAILVGGLAEGDQGLLVCHWTLIAIN